MKRCEVGWEAAGTATAMCSPWYWACTSAPASRHALVLLNEATAPGPCRGSPRVGHVCCSLRSAPRHAPTVAAAAVPPCAAFAAKTRQVAEAQFDAAWLREHWELRLVPTGGAPGPPRTFADLESEERYADYCAAAFLPDDAQLDIVAVHGFARMACLRRAVQLLRPQGGLLVLPQAQRPAYRAAAALVPPHWLRLTDSHDLGQTIVWMSMRKA